MEEMAVRAHCESYNDAIASFISMFATLQECVEIYGSYEEAEQYAANSVGFLSSEAFFDEMKRWGIEKWVPEETLQVNRVLH